MLPLRDDSARLLRTRCSMRTPHRRPNASRSKNPRRGLPALPNLASGKMRSQALFASEKNSLPSTTSRRTSLLPQGNQSQGEKPYLSPNMGCILIGECVRPRDLSAGQIAAETALLGGLVAGAVLAPEALTGAGAIQATVHGATRIAGAAATRGGVLTAEEIAATRAGGVLYESASNGTVIHVVETAAGRYNVVVDGAKGLVTTLKNIPYKELVRSACNYGWFCPL
jgi:hypothetical protein